MSPDLTPRDELRASDADRDAVALRLSDALSDGRLDLAEYQSRLDSAMGARTVGELAPLTTDIPAPGSPGNGPVDLAHTGRENAPPSWRERTGKWNTWMGGAGVMITVWLVSSIAAGDLQGFWPAMPLAIWALVIISGGCRR
ncbi:hypothetical protein LP52_23820 [Streptomonospora alba]|uniref:DUF1707 domain-containing protein n=1 Tax=Streptomonospora alba TaxID=183763 RepID=A0A0C2JI15_9ACTN|nr:DUF1707 domain-containing protein [Streptomonospora alba]KIH96602.1 hypothetical protein LP52_23820 [Streptomonospora alba]